MTEKRPTRTQEALRLTEVPREKWFAILRRVAFGVALGVLAFYGTEKGWNPWLLAALWAGCGFNISRQLFNATVDAILRLGRRVLALVVESKAGPLDG